MQRKKQYVFNKETLSYEVIKTSKNEVIKRAILVFVAGLAIFVGYYCLYTKVLHQDAPKTVMLEKKNKELISKISVINQRLDDNGKILSELQMRDNIVYRPIFGMDEISNDIRSAGFGGVDRYVHLEKFDNAEFLISSEMKMDYITKKAYIQSRSFDDVATYSKRAGDMASCIPTIYPVVPDSRNHQSSSFGYRRDPFDGSPRLHTGIDISGPSGEPIFSTGNGIVVKAERNFFGYGICVVVDHGFGYKTRYAHLKDAMVVEGQHVMRGDQVGRMGSTGRSKGTHLHYEVIYKDKPVNPWNYFTNDLNPEEYKAMVKTTKSRG